MGKAKNTKNFSENNQKENTRIKSRKRKASGQLNPGRSKLAASNHDYVQQTRHLYQEMGVDCLSSDSDSCSSFTELTPSITVNNGSRTAPGAPRVLLPSQKQNVQNTTISDESSFSPTSSPTTFQSLSSSNFTCKRKIYLPEKDHFSQLSDEIVLYVFHWLPKFTLAKCARVCHRWKRLVMDESLWKRVDLANRSLPHQTLFHVLNRGVNILRLTKTEIEGISQPSPLPSLSIRFFRVQYLDLSMSSVSIPLLEELFSLCKELKKLSLEHCELSDKACQNIGENKDLEVLNMSMCQGITAAGLMPIATNCRRLESLNLAWTSLHRHSVVYLSLCLPSSLHKLNISGCRENITDEEILQLCNTCPYLKELDLSDSTVLTCTTIQHLTEKLNHLEYLALSRNYRIMPQTIMQLQKIETLAAIDLFGMFREGALKQLRESMPHLNINKFPFSSIARPTTGIRRTSLWGLRVRDTVI